MLPGALKMVRRFPSRMVPPICPGLCSGMSITCGHTPESQTLEVTLRSAQRSGQVLRTTGCLDSGSNSVELASEPKKKEMQVRNVLLDI